MSGAANYGLRRRNANRPGYWDLHNQNKHLRHNLREKRNELRDAEQNISHHKDVAAENIKRNSDLQDTVRQLIQERDQLKGTNETLHAQVSEYSANNAGIQDGNRLLQSTQAENRRLQDQIAEYKLTISCSSQLTDEVADDVIRSMADQLFFNIQEFVVDTFRRKAFDFTHLPEDTKALMRDYAPLADTMPKPFWLSIIRAFIAKIMITHFLPRFFFGFSEALPMAAAMNLANLLPDTGSKKWMIATRKLLNESHPGAVRESEKSHALELVHIVQAHLRKAVTIDWTDDVDLSLEKIFRDSQEFYRQVYHQQSDIKVEMPKALAKSGAAKTFDPKHMEAVNATEDDAVLQGKPIAVTLFPAVYKLLEPKGNKKTYIVLAKAKVVVQVE